MLGSRGCKECGKVVALKIARDLHRKFFCCRSCANRFNSRLRDQTKMWAAANTPQSNAKKGRKGSAHCNWKPDGTRSRSWHGYIKVKRGGKWLYEHRVVASAGPGEFVHHRDLSRSNNSPANLEKMSNSDHVALHHKLRKRGHYAKP